MTRTILMALVGTTALFSTPVLAQQSGEASQAQARNDCRLLVRFLQRLP